MFRPAKNDLNQVIRIRPRCVCSLVNRKSSGVEYVSSDEE